MGLGRYRHHLLVQKRNTTPDGQGGLRVQWQDVGVFPCNIMTMSLRERNRYQQYQIDATHKVHMRDSGDDGDIVDDNMRAFDVTNDAGTGTHFDILSVQDIQKQDRYLEVILRETKLKGKQG